MEEQNHSPFGTPEEPDRSSSQSQSQGASGSGNTGFDFESYKREHMPPPNQNAFRPQPNGFSIASMVCGICSVVFSCCCDYLPILLGVLAITFAIVVRVCYHHLDGMAIAGLTCGIIGLVFEVASLIMSFLYRDQINAWLEQFKQQFGQSLPTV